MISGSQMAASTTAAQNCPEVHSDPREPSPTQLLIIDEADRLGAPRLRRGAAVLGVVAGFPDDLSEVVDAR